MHRTFLLVLALVSAMAGSASAASFGVTSFVGDAKFNEICRLETTNNQECENAIGEFRGGNGATNGTFERSLNLPGTFGVVQGQNTWVTGATRAFSMSYDGIDTLSLMLAGVPTISMGPSIPAFGGLGGANTMFIRVRNDSATNTMSLTSMMLDGMSVGNLVSGQATDDGGTVGEGSTGAGYLRIDGFDFSQAWTLTGDVQLTWTGAIPTQSRLDANFKVATIPSEVPLPAAGWLLIAGLGGLGALRRFARA